MSWKAQKVNRIYIVGFRTNTVSIASIHKSKQREFQHKKSKLEFMMN